MRAGIKNRQNKAMIPFHRQHSGPWLITEDSDVKSIIRKHYNRRFQSLHRLGKKCSSPVLEAIS